MDLFFPFFGYSDISFCFCFDYVSMMFFSVISLISSVVFYYRKFYIDINYDGNTINYRFISILFLFVGSMFFLVFSFSWLSLMLGWDGLGVVSFLLVIFYNNSSRLNSGLITIFTNRFGDCLFILRFISIYFSGSFYISFLDNFSSYLICFIIIIGAFTKSAQVPFSSWLPAAIAAPTPVSSLVHSSTLVTAGVYLIYRFCFLFFDCFFFISILSIFTIFIAGLCRMIEFDFKKVVAISTLSQLGFMIFSISLGIGCFCFLHMMFHAFFKRILFLSTGALIHNISGDQDSRFFGSFSDSFFSKCFFNCRCMRLIGFPFTIGFYRKDFIISYFTYNDCGLFLLVFFISCCLTVSYSFRLISMGSFLFPSYSSSLSFTESSSFFFPVILLFICCLLGGNFFIINFFPLVIFSFLDLFIGLIAILLGTIIFKLFDSYYFMVVFLSFIGFIRILIGSSISVNIPFVRYREDFYWVESLGGKGVSLLLYNMSIFSNSLFYFSITYLPFFLFVVILLCFFVVTPGCQFWRDWVFPTIF